MKTSPHWIVDEYMLEVSERKEEIVAYLEKQGNYTITPFTRIHKIDIPDDFSIGSPFKCGIIYGSIQFVNKCLEQSCLYPGSYYSATGYQLQNYLSSYEPHYFLNRHGFFVPFRWMFGKFSYYQSLLGERIFIRPNSGKKLFTGQVVESIDDLNMLYKTSSVVDNTLVYISGAKELSHEFRYIIVDGKVVGHSQYHVNGEISITEDDNTECRALAQSLADDTDEFNNTFVCDVGLCDGLPFVIELNCINTSGWYLANVSDIMNALNEKLIKEFEER